MSGTPNSKNLVSTGSLYWFATAYDTNDLWYGGCWFGGYFDNCYGVRPVVSLKSGIQITGGSGTWADPYQIK